MFLLGIVCLCSIVYNSYGLTCLNCPSITHARFCRHVRQCSQGQVCGSERLVDAYGDVVYKLGCVDQKGCKSYSYKRLLDGLPKTTDAGNPNCFHCCSSDLCNTNGCGETDTLQQNTKVCFQCNGLVQGDVCKMITYCHDNEMCHIQERSRQGENFYESGCMQTHACLSVYKPIIGRRQIKRYDSQPRCCVGRLCNQDYASISAPTQLPWNHLTTPVFNGHHRTDIKGTSFVLNFPRIVTVKSSPQALVAAHDSGIVCTFSFSSHYNTSAVYSPTNYTVPFNKSVYMEDGTFHRGVELTFTSEVKVYGFTYASDKTERYSEGYLAIPKKYLSTKYIIPTFKAYHDYTPNTIVITGTLPNTIINIYSKVNGAVSAYSNVVLKQFDTYKMSAASDFSGTLITSTHPIAVISGSAHYYVKTGGYGPLLEMVLPVNQWDNTYIIPNIATRPTKLVRLFSNKTTNVSIHYIDKTETKVIPERGFIEFEHSQHSYLNANYDIMVQIVPHGLADGSGDHFLMNIHGLNQYLTEYEFAVPDGFTNFVSVAVSSDSVSGFLLDGRPMQQENLNHIFGGPNHFSTFTATVPSGVHKISHSSNVKFGLWVYGNGPKDGYGYPAGIAFKV